MDAPSNRDLLAAWAERKDESAFRSLVERFGGFVYGVALRRTADSSLAEEVTQDVLAQLANHAGRLVSHPTLAGWLHRSTMLIALDRIRRNSRHARKLAQLATMHQSSREPWQDILPLLDQAIDCLSSRDREVVMLHFIERRTFPEIARTLGGSPDSVRMRTNRALSELIRVLGKKGVAIPVATLATALLGTAAHAAPASLSTLASTALAGTGQVSFSSTVLHLCHTMNTAKAATFAALVVVLAIPIASQQSAIANARERISHLQNGPASGTVGSLRSTALNASSHTLRGIDLRQLGRDSVQDTPIGELRIPNAVAHLDANNLAGLLDTVVQSDLLRVQREHLGSILLAELRRRDPGLAVKWAMKAPSDSIPDIDSTVVAAFLEWVKKSPAEATAWMDAHADEWVAFIGESIWIPSPDTLLVGGLLASDPKQAYARLNAMSIEAGEKAIWNASDLLTESQVSDLSKWAATIPDTEKRRRLVFQSVALTPELEGENYFTTRARAILTVPLNDDDFAWVAARVVVKSSFPVRDARKEPPTPELEWIEKNVPPARQDYMKGQLGHLFVPARAFEVLGKQLDAQPQDDLIAGYVESEDLRGHAETGDGKGESRFGETAFKLATRTQDSKRRIDLLARAWDNLHKESAPAAQAILEIPELNAADKVLLEARIAHSPHAKL